MNKYLLNQNFFCIVVLIFCFQLQETAAQKGIDTIHYFGNNHIPMSFKKISRQLSQDSVIITTDSLFVFYKEVNRYDRNALQKRIALKDITNIKKKSLYPALMNPMFLLNVIGMGSMLQQAQRSLPVLNYSLASFFCLSLYPTIRYNRIVELTINKDETLFLYAGFKTRKIYRNLKARLLSVR